SADHCRRRIPACGAARRSLRRWLDPARRLAGARRAGRHRCLPQDGGRGGPRPPEPAHHLVPRAPRHPAAAAVREDRHRSRRLLAAGGARRGDHAHPRSLGRPAAPTRRRLELVRRPARLRCAGATASWRWDCTPLPAPASPTTRPACSPAHTWATCTMDRLCYSRVKCPLRLRSRSSQAVSCSPPLSIQRPMPRRVASRLPVAACFGLIQPVSGRGLRLIAGRHDVMKHMPGEDIAGAARQWLAAFEQALARGDESLDALFQSDSHWRDVLALTWRIDTVSGRESILESLRGLARDMRPTALAIDPERTPPRRVRRAGADTIEAIFTFETAIGRGEGVVRLVSDAQGTLRAWTLLTALSELRGHEEQVGGRRPHGESYSRDFRGPNWLDLRNLTAPYADRDPTVPVVGGGQPGLSIAARLAQLGVDTLIVDRLPRIGDNWRKRYHALTLHNQVQVNHLPYMQFPPAWPTYIP